jgi:hypothetical protein
VQRSMKIGSGRGKRKSISSDSNVDQSPVEIRDHEVDPVLVEVDLPLFILSSDMRMPTRSRMTRIKARPRTRLSRVMVAEEAGVNDRKH